MTPSRGEILWIDLGEFGSLGQWGRRPAIVISNDFFNSRLDTVVVVPLSANVSRAGAAGVVLVPRGGLGRDTGLTGDSVALCHSPLTVPKNVLGDRIGVLEHRLLSEIDDNVAFALDLAPNLGE